MIFLGWGVRRPKSYVQMLVDLGRDVYQDEFERGYVRQAEEAYQVPTAPAVCNDPVSNDRVNLLGLGQWQLGRICALCALKSMLRRLGRLLCAIGIGFCCWPCSVSCTLVQAEAQELLASCDCAAYLRRAERRLVEESERCQSYMDASTDAKVARVVELCLVEKQVHMLSGTCITSYVTGVQPSRAARWPCDASDCLRGRRAAVEGCSCTLTLVLGCITA